MKKTEFQELWSVMNYTDKYDKNTLILYFEDREGLLPIHLTQIISKRGRMFRLHKVQQYDDKIADEDVEIPEYRFWVVTEGDVIIFDRREHYQGTKELILPTETIWVNKTNKF